MWCLCRLFRYLSAFGNSQANDLVTEPLPKSVISCVVGTMRENRLLLFLNHLRLACSILKSFALLLAFHLARHTFATTVTYANGVSIESISKMLGHTKLATTQIYARIVDQTVSREMDKLSAALSDTSFSLNNGETSTQETTN